MQEASLSPSDKANSQRRKILPTIKEFLSGEDRDEKGEDLAPHTAVSSARQGRGFGTLRRVTRVSFLRPISIACLTPFPLERTRLSPVGKGLHNQSRALLL